MILAVLPYVLPFLVPAQGFAHIEGILDRFSASRVITVVINYSSENTISIVTVSCQHENSSWPRRGRRAWRIVF